MDKNAHRYGPYLYYILILTLTATFKMCLFAKSVNSELFFIIMLE